MRPVTNEQWQDAVDAAHTLLQLSIGQLYKLVKPMPEIDVEECVMILAEGAQRDIYPGVDITALLDATDTLLKKSDTTEWRKTLHSEQWVGKELFELRRAALVVKIRRLPYADRKVS